MTSVAMPAACAVASPPAFGRFDATSTISAGKVLSFAASISAAMLEPRPEIRTATRLRLMSPSIWPEIERAIIRDARAAGRAIHLAEREGAFRRPCVKAAVDASGIGRPSDDDHADAAVEGAQHLVLRDAAFGRRAI